MVCSLLFTDVLAALGNKPDRLWKARQPTVCPHGRPTTLRLGRDQIEKTFGRIWCGWY